MATSLAEVFQKDPLILTKEDLTQVIEGMRAARANFQTGNKSAGSRKNTGSSGGKKSLDDLLGDEF